jgi:hypothetical protein
MPHLHLIEEHNRFFALLGNEAAFYCASVGRTKLVRVHGMSLNDDSRLMVLSETTYVFLRLSNIYATVQAYNCFDSSVTNRERWLEFA